MTLAEWKLLLSALWELIKLALPSFIVGAIVFGTLALCIEFVIPALRALRACLKSGGRWRDKFYEELGRLPAEKDERKEG